MTATEWAANPGEAKRQGGLQAVLRRLSFVPLIVVDEVGYIPFDPEAAKLMFSLVSVRYERASMIVTFNKPFPAWGEIFGDEVIATAMIDRFVHHVEFLSLKVDSYRFATRTWSAHRRPSAPEADDGSHAPAPSRGADRLSGPRPGRSGSGVNFRSAGPSRLARARSARPPGFAPRAPYPILGGPVFNPQKSSFSLLTDVFAAEPENRIAREERGGGKTSVVGSPI